jgi:hypothetical protein
MPESSSEKLRRIIIELARIRNGLRELVSEQQATAGAAVAGAVSGTAGTTTEPAIRQRRGSNDPLEEILEASAPVNPQQTELLNPDDEDGVVVDISLPSNRGTGDVKPELFSDDKKRTKSYPKKPPPRKS